MGSKRQRRRKKKNTVKLLKFKGPCGTGQLSKVLQENARASWSSTFRAPRGSREGVRTRRPCRLLPHSLEGFQPQSFYSGPVGALRGRSDNLSSYTFSWLPSPGWSQCPQGYVSRLGKCSTPPPRGFLFPLPLLSLPSASLLWDPGLPSETAAFPLAPTPTPAAGSLSSPRILRPKTLGQTPYLFHIFTCPDYFFKGDLVEFPRGRNPLSILFKTALKS